MQVANMKTGASQEMKTSTAQSSQASGRWQSDAARVTINTTRANPQANVEPYLPSPTSASDEPPYDPNAANSNHVNYTSVVVGGLGLGLLLLLFSSSAVSESR